MSNNGTSSCCYYNNISHTPSAVLDSLFQQLPAAAARRRDLDLNDPCSRFRFILNALVIGTLCIVGLTGNTIAIVVLRRDRQSRVAVFLLQSLAAADNLVLAVSFVVLSLFYGLLPSVGGSAAVERSVPYLIKYVNPLGYAVQCCAVWITVLLAVNRFVAVCRPFTAHKRLTMTAARIQVLVVVALSILLNIPRIFKYDIAAVVTITSDGNSTVTSEKAVFSTLGRNVHFEMVYFTVFYTSVVLLLPLLLLVVLNATLVRQLRASRRRMQRHSLGYESQSESDVTVIMVAIVLLLVICHTPDRILQLIHFTQYDNEMLGCPSALFISENISTLLIIISSASDFIVYYVFRRRFRVLVWNQLVAVRCCFCCNADERLQRQARGSGQTEEFAVDELFCGTLLSNGRHRDSRTPPGHGENGIEAIAKS